MSGNGRKSLVLSSGSVHRWGDFCERSPIDHPVTGIGRDRATGRAVVLDGRAHLVSRGAELLTPAILRRGLAMTGYSCSERSTVG
jgi:hypothetical protein